MPAADGYSPTPTNSSRRSQDYGRSWRIRYRSTSAADGDAHPVNVRVATAGGPPADLAVRRWATVATPSDLIALRANRALDALNRDGDGSAVGADTDLTIRGVLLPQGIQTTADGAAAELVTLDGLATIGSTPPPSSEALRVTVYGRGLDAPPFLLHRSGTGGRLDRGVWRFRTLFDLPTAIDELAVMVEDLRNDRWRVAFLEVASNPVDDRSDAELLAPGAGERTEAEILAEARAAARRAGWTSDASSGGAKRARGRSDAGRKPGPYPAPARPEHRAQRQTILRHGRDEHRRPPGRVLPRRRTGLRRPQETLRDEDRPGAGSGSADGPDRRLRPVRPVAERGRAEDQPATGKDRHRHRLGRSAERRPLRHRGAGGRDGGQAAGPGRVLPQRPPGGDDDPAPIPHHAAGPRSAGSGLRARRRPLRRRHDDRGCGVPLGRPAQSQRRPSTSSRSTSW